MPQPQASPRWRPRRRRGDAGKGAAARRRGGVILPLTLVLGWALSPTAATAQGTHVATEPVGSDRSVPAGMAGAAPVPTGHRSSARRAHGRTTALVASRAPGAAAHRGATRPPLTSLEWFFVGFTLTMLVQAAALWAFHRRTLRRRRATLEAAYAGPLDSGAHDSGRGRAERSGRLRRFAQRHRGVILIGGSDAPPRRLRRRGRIIVRDFATAAAGPQADIGAAPPERLGSPGAPAVAPAAETAVAPRTGGTERVWPRTSPRTDRLLLAAILAIGSVVRVWHIDAVGLNSDEAVYAGQGAAIAGNDDLAPYFPTFRAHPLLFQTTVSIGFKLGHPELFGRLSAAALGIATIFVVYLTGRLLYGRRAGLIGAALLAVMPYHVLVTRQILLDGPMVFMSTLTLYLFARYAATERRPWFYATAVGMGLTFLSKESSVILLGSIYTFLALTPAVRTGLRHFVGAGALFVVVVSAFPLALSLAGKTGTGGNFLAWQLFRRPNHTWLFYPAVVPLAIGLGVVLAAALGLWLLRRDGSWRETLLLSWIVVPVAFFQLFPVKGFQYLLPVAPAVAILAGRFFAHWDPRSLSAPPSVPLLKGEPARRAASALGRVVAVLSDRRSIPIGLGLVLLTLLVPTIQRVQPSRASTFLAGSGGVPGGREAGYWIARHAPEGARMMSVGPSMANILQYYGRRKVYGLSVSPNPLHRNPVYEPMRNPDRLIRDNELQYVVWDAFSADRSPFFARKIIRYVERYNGHVAHTETVPIRSPDGRLTHKPVITIYEVNP